MEHLNIGTQENTVERVRAHTPSPVLAEIDRDMAARVQYYATQPSDIITRRIEELEREWDTERVLEANAATLAFLGVVLGVSVYKRWLWLPGVVLPFLFQHAVQGWCPPLPLTRALGVRTRREIDAEMYALKARRGDFSAVQPDGQPEVRVAQMADLTQIVSPYAPVASTLAYDACLRNVISVRCEQWCLVSG